MTGLVRADWVRFRHRYDLWIVLLGALLLGVFAYWSGATSANGPVPLEPIDASLPPDAQAQIRAMNAGLLTQVLAVRDQYVFPRSIVTMLGIGNWLFMAAAFVAASWIATEFEWGTIRNVVLAEPRRGRFLAVRVVSLIVVSALAIGALIGLGAILPLVLPTVGSGGPSGVTPVDVVLTAGGVLVWCVAFIAVATLAAVVTRSPILALIATFGYFLLESIVDNAQVWEVWGQPLEWGRQFLLGFRLNALSSDVRAATGLRQPFEPPPTVPPVHLEPVTGVAVIVAWVALLLGTAWLVLRRADIRE
jgi:hypothetical protein